MLVHFCPVSTKDRMCENINRTVCPELGKAGKCLMYDPEKKKLNEEGTELVDRD